MAERSRPVEDLVIGTMFHGQYAGRRVLVTGHTGFKGSWLCEWLLELGADVAGYSIGIPTDPSNFEVLGLAERIRHHQGDVRDRNRLRAVCAECRPDYVFHLAAQSLVRRSYEDPVTTFEVNTIGTLNVLDCIRQSRSVRAAVIITSDKCYRNHGWPWGYRETDTLGGEDPYSASKACAELVAYSFVRSYLAGGDGARVATTRAGNVIGGGDWAPDRLIPDCVRSWSKGRTVSLRQPEATRPWQHVLEPLSGYLWLGVHLWQGTAQAAGGSYNFGPSPTVNCSVETLARMFGRYWPAANWRVDADEAAAYPEAAVLKLSCDKAFAELGWSATLSFEETVRLTAEWYRRYYELGAGEMPEFTRAQINEYCRLARERNLPWARV